MKYFYFTLLGLLCTYFSGCTSGPSFSALQSQCNFLSGISTTSHASAQMQTKIETCHAAIKREVNFDDSFDVFTEQQWTGVLESFRVLLTFPFALPPHLRLPGSSTLSTATSSIPLDVLQIFRPQDFMNFSGRETAAIPVSNETIWRFLFPKIDRFHFDGVSEDEVASERPDGPSVHGVITLTNGFLNNPTILKVSTLLHEARHADGIWHVPCRRVAAGTTAPRPGVVCDETLGGPYTLTILAIQMLTLGALHRMDDEGQRLWDGTNFASAALLVAERSRRYINILPEDLDTFWSVVADIYHPPFQLYNDLGLEN